MIVGVCSYHSRNIDRRKYEEKCCRKGKKCHYLIIGVVIKSKAQNQPTEKISESMGLPLAPNPV